MNYNELTFLAKEKKITMSELAKQIGMTLTGFKPSIENGTFPINKVLPLCQMLGISPNELLGWPEHESGGNYAANIGGSNTQNSTETITALGAQLEEKDRQIDRLLKIIEKNKSLK